MNIDNLKKLFDENKIPTAGYNLKGEMVSHSITLEKRKTGWYVYYSERGEIYEEVGLSNENDACEYMKKYVINSYKDATRKRQ